MLLPEQLCDLTALTSLDVSFNPDLELSDIVSASLTSSRRSTSCSCWACGSVPAGSGKAGTCK